MTLGPDGSVAHPPSTAAARTNKKAMLNFIFIGIVLLYLEVFPKPHLASDSGVADLFKMLTYFNVCCAFSSACALLSNAICGFKITSTARASPVPPSSSPPDNF
jgi:hypothetical protein